MPTAKTYKFEPKLDEIYSDLSGTLRRMNHGASEEDLIDFETTMGFLMKIFPGSHYKCEMEEDSYNVIESLVLYYNEMSEEEVIKVVHPEDC